MKLLRFALMIMLLPAVSRGAGMGWLTFRPLKTALPSRSNINVNLPLSTGELMGRKTVVLYYAVSPAELKKLEAHGRLIPNLNGKRDFEMIWSGATSDKQRNIILRLHFAPELFDYIAGDGKWRLGSQGLSAGLINYAGLPDGAIIVSRDSHTRQILKKDVFSVISADATAIPLFNSHFLGFDQWQPHRAAAASR